MLSLPARIPTATYRLQLNPEFGFDAACELAPYLSRLGISEIYASPIFQASSSSTHGYDINDQNQISSALGGREGFEQFSKALQAENLGLLVDFVPNHMGIDGEYNWRWQDVLENGENSRFAPYFDIEWQPRLDRLKDRVLVPILGAHYGTVLEKGDLVLHYGEGRFCIRYGRFRLPLRPRTYGTVLQELAEQLPAGDERRARLRSLSDAFENLPVEDTEQREVLLHKTRARLAELLVSDDLLRARLEDVLKKFNGIPGDPSTFESLHALLEDQHYRLAYWKVGAHEVNYRRFFAIDTLVGLKMEIPEVFDATHRASGSITSTVSGIPCSTSSAWTNSCAGSSRARVRSTRSSKKFSPRTKRFLPHGPCTEPPATNFVPASSTSSSTVPMSRPGRAFTATSPVSVPPAAI
jgi:(1->4)-alpha-D-glucan 1-alpha-D-glucosylmutase